MKNLLKIDGTKYWYKNDVLHRKDGPAVEWYNGDKEYWINGKRHRENGPAIEHSNGYKEYYLNNKRIYASSDEKFKRIIKLKYLL